MRFGRRVQTIDRVGCERDGGVEPETIGRANDIVVDRLRDTDNRNAERAELVGDGQCAIAADGDQRAEPHLVEYLRHSFGVEAGPPPRAHLLRNPMTGVSRAPKPAPPTPEPPGVTPRE